MPPPDNFYNGWYLHGTYAIRHGVTINTTDEEGLKRMIDRKHYEAREERRLRGDAVGMF